MRPTLRSMLAVFALYLAILGGFALWMEYELRALTGDVVANTARLLGHEVALTMGSTPGPLLPVDPAARQRLRHAVDEVSNRSELVRAIAVVDGSGTIVASDNSDEVGRRVSTPDEIFHGSPTSRLVRPPGTRAYAGQYVLFVPVIRHQTTVGYLRFAIESSPIAELYHHAQQELLFVALIGLGCIGALALLVHAQLTRRSQALARVFERARKGETVAPPERDVFASAFEAAGKLGREITEAREEGAQAQRRFDALADTMNVGLVLLDPDGRVDFASARACQLFGADGVAFEERWNAARAPIAQALATLHDGTARSTQLDLDLGEGERSLWLDLHRLGQERDEGYLMLVRDRGTISSLETDLRLATQLRVLARLYRAVAHELKAPLHAMVLNLELLDETLATTPDDDPGTRERQRRYVDVLKQEFARLNRSLHNLLETAPASDTSGRYDLRALIQELETLVSAQARHQRVDMHLRLPPHSMVVTGHRDRMKQAMLNIAINALEAMPHGGRLDLALERSNGQACIAIRDTGPGIPPDLLNQIGEIHVTTKDGGSGIGLAVARSVIEACGGTIQVDTVPGEGSCFRVNLPLSSETEAL